MPVPEAQHAGRPRAHARLLAHLAARGLAERLAELEHPARQLPLLRRRARGRARRDRVGGRVRVAPLAHDEQLAARVRDPARAADLVRREPRHLVLRLGLQPAVQHRDLARRVVVPERREGLSFIPERSPAARGTAGSRAAARAASAARAWHAQPRALEAVRAPRPSSCARRPLSANAASARRPACARRRAAAGRRLRAQVDERAGVRQRRPRQRQRRLAGGRRGHQRARRALVWPTRARAEERERATRAARARCARAR